MNREEEKKLKLKIRENNIRMIKAVSIKAMHDWYKIDKALKEKLRELKECKR